MPAGILAVEQPRQWASIYLNFVRTRHDLMPSHLQAAMAVQRSRRIWTLQNQQFFYSLGFSSLPHLIYVLLGLSIPRLMCCPSLPPESRRCRGTTRAGIYRRRRRKSRARACEEDQAGPRGRRRRETSRRRRRFLENFSSPTSFEKEGRKIFLWGAKHENVVKVSRVCVRHMCDSAT